jgi:hypothetical protein
MPDLTQGPSSYVAANYRRALDNFSRFGTRKLVFYTIVVYGLTDATMDTIYNLEDTYGGNDNSYPAEWIEAPGSILEAIQRGVQLVAEPYAYGDWDDNYEGPDYNDIAITAIVASDTVEDSAEQNQHNSTNQHSYTMETAILDAISNFANDGVEVHRAYMLGTAINEGSYALARVRGGTDESKARWAARLAKGKNAVKRQG